MDKVIFIISSARSGSTLLGKNLDNYPNTFLMKYTQKHGRSVFKVPAKASLQSAELSPAQQKDIKSGVEGSQALNQFYPELKPFAGQP